MIERKNRLRRLDDFTKKRIVKLKSQGVDRTAIADRLDVAVSTVDKIVRENGQGSDRDLYSDAELLMIVELFMEGCSNADIAKKVGRTYWAIAQKLSNLGLKRTAKFVISKSHPWHQELRQSYLRNCND